MHDAPLLREIAAAPESATPYLVYADALLQRGDPHGELIVVQHALESARGLETAVLRRREAALFDAHLDEWLGDLAQYRDWLILRWSRGFIHGARIRLRRPGHKPLHHVAAIRALLDTPIASLIVDLRIGPHQDAGLHTQPLLDELATSWPAALRRLHLGDAWSLDLTPLAGARLDELVVQAPRITLWPGAAPAIRSLAIEQPAFDVRQLAGEAWPALEQLSLACAEPGPLDWLAPTRYPRLRHLTLRGARDPDTLACDLVTHPIVDQLAVIELTGALGGWGLGACAALARRSTIHVNRQVVGDPALDVQEQTWRRELDPRLRSEGLALYRKLAEACEQRGDLAGAESWLWQASHHAAWYRWSDPYALLDQIATLQLRAGDIAAAAPLRKRVIAQLHDKPLARGRAFLELGLAELARGRLARAEADCRTALEIAGPEPQLEAALAALLWSRDDVESTARGAWLFALYQLGTAEARATQLARSAAPDQIVATSSTLFEQHGAPRGAILARTLLAELAMRRNNHTRASDHLAHVLATATGNERAIALGVMARIAIARADYPAAHRLAAEACELHHAAEHRFGAAMQLATMADAALGERCHEEVRRHARDALALLVPDAEYPAIASVRMRLGHAAQLEHRRDEAEHHYAAAIVDARRDHHLAGEREPQRVPRREPVLVGIAETWLAVLRAQDARPTEAYALLGRARDKLPRARDAASETLAMATRVVARFAGSNVPLPAATRLSPRLVSALLV